MKFALLFSFILYSFIALAGIHGSVVVPINLGQIDDSSCITEIKSIFCGMLDSGMKTYKTHRYEKLIINKASSWRFYIAFNNDIANRINKKQFALDCPTSMPVLHSIRYEHVKYMLIIEENELRTVNKEIAELCNDRPIYVSAESYISGDRFRNYLYLFVSNNTQKKEFVFVIKNSVFYQCVVNN